jgi:protein involved in polysaccharide export with SLBB domain
VEALQQEVFIQGEIHKQGNYEIFPSSTLGEMIELAYGFTQDAEQNEILIYRFANGETEIFTYNFNADKNKVVKDQDRIVIHRKVSLKNKDDFVYVQGQIKFPGQYPFEEEKTTLLDLINYAGGILEYADLSYVYIQRQASDEIFNKEKLRLAEKPVTDMTHIEKEYLKASWRYASDKIFINLEDLLETKDENLNIHLKKDDLLYIPDKTKTITVTGHVKFPGKITFLPNTSFQHYIEKVGGYSWHVDKKNVRIVRYLTGEWVKPDELTTLYPGDMIVVPEKKVYDKWELSKDVLQVLVQFTTLVVLINNLSTK